MELAAILSAIALLAVIALPVLANSKPRADRVTCVNNLRLIGRAEQVWANDHADALPWRVDISEGGTQHSPLQNNAWFNYGKMSNELANPAILACPSDTTAKVARNFSSSPVDGFFNPRYRNNALSYFIGLDSYLVEGSVFNSPFTRPSALAGDRNLQVDAVNQACSSGVTLAASVYGVPSSVTQWTNALHGLVGNVLEVDGQVLQTPSARVAWVLLGGFGDDNASLHFLVPR